MRIELCIQALIAVLGLAAVVDQVTSLEHSNSTIHGSRLRRSSRKRHVKELWYPHYKHEIKLHDAGVHLNYRQNQMLLKMENRTLDCCPSVLEMIEPDGGKNQEDQFVELYRDGDYRQRFYELSCHKDILHKPCRFMEKKLHNQSSCEQQYSYSYALVKDLGGHRAKNFPTFPASGPGGTTSWTLDYIQVRSGCRCVVNPPPQPALPPNHKKKRFKSKHHKKVSRQ